MKIEENWGRYTPAKEQSGSGILHGRRVILYFSILY
jgi:hypothetical protein